jgi:lipopolysaccharide heptosyltransferase I
MPLKFPPPKRVLIIKPSAIGDIVHAIPAVARIRRRWPKAHISWLAGTAYASLLENHPMIDEVIHFRRYRWGRRWYIPEVQWELAQFFKDLRRREFDLAIDFQGLFRSAAVALATGAPRRVGFANAREGAAFFYTERVECSAEQEHAVDRNLKLAASVGAAAGPIEFPLAVDEKDRELIARLVPPDVKFALLLPGTNWETKRWPVEHFAELAGPLGKEFGLATVVAGSARDAELSRRIPAQFDLTGKTNLRQTVALLQRAELVIANDSGPMHLAAALGKPLVTLFGPTSARRTGPYGRMDSVIRIDLPCSPCYSRKCIHQSCLRWLETGVVLKSIKKQLDRGKREVFAPQ